MIRVDGQPLGFRPRILEMVGLRLAAPGPPNREQKPGIDLRIQIGERRLAPTVWHLDRRAPENSTL